MPNTTRHSSNTSRKQATILERRIKVSKLYRRGWNQYDIAAELEVTQSTISVDLKALRQQWQEKADTNFAAKQFETLAKIDHMEFVAWEDYEASKAERTETQTSTDGTRKAARQKKVQRDGNVEYLRVVQWCIEQRCKILGIYEATKIQLDWRRAAEEQGLNAGDLFEQAVNAWIGAIDRNTN